jgi:hypothetical protein
MYETLDEALYIANGIEAPAVRAVALTQIAFLMAKARRTEEASDVLKKALDAAKVMEERFRKSLISVGEGTERNEPDETASIHPPFYDSAMESIAMGFAAIGRQPEALRVICEMPPGHRADAIALRLLSRYAEVGRFETALGLVRMIDDTRKRASALFEIAENYRQQDQKLGKRAERILHEIVVEIARAQDGATDWNE